MSTLSNVETPGVEANTPSISVVSDAIPQAVNIQNGVSVDCAYISENAEKHWYVFPCLYYYLLLQIIYRKLFLDYP